MASSSGWRLKHVGLVDGHVAAGDVLVLADAVDVPTSLIEVGTAAGGTGQGGVVDPGTCPGPPRRSP
jgi:hypothetical protein